MGIFGKKEKNEIQKEISNAKIISESVDPEIAAAISVALNLHLQESSDYENMVLTIQKVVRPYSPWSSKIYGLRQYPRR